MLLFGGAVSGCGLGISAGEAKGEVKITGMQKDGPADMQGGLSVGDLIVEVDGNKVDMQSCAAALRGKFESLVQIKAVRMGGFLGPETITAKIKRGVTREIAAAKEAKKTEQQQGAWNLFGGGASDDKKGAPEKKKDAGSVGGWFGAASDVKEGGTAKKTDAGDGGGWFGAPAAADTKAKGAGKKKDDGGEGGWFGVPAAAETKAKSAEKKWDPFAPVKGPGLALGPGTVKGEVIITGVKKNGPADLQSMTLKVGDVVVGVDDASVKGQSVEGIASKLREPAGSEVRIKVERRGLMGDQYVHARVRRGDATAVAKSPTPTATAAGGGVGSLTLDIFGAKPQGKTAAKKDDGWNPFAAADAKPVEKNKDLGGRGGWFGAPAPPDSKAKGGEQRWDPFAGVKGPGLALGPGTVTGQVIITGVLKDGPADMQSRTLKIGDAGI
ncbi:hypothetical protein T484DRAFT_1889829 [Baffinella frigidus]|nr:hypothetical protein T484DRAFT_1889829 [Cryptophyta sp. CCMP2293]